MIKMLNIHDAGELSKFLFSGQASSTNSNSYVLNSNNTFDQSFDSLFANINPCTYYDDSDSIPNQTPSSNELIFVHANNRSLNKNFDDLSHFLAQFSVSPDVICITKTPLKDTSFVNIFIPGYEFVFVNSLSAAGGVGVYVSIIIIIIMGF